MKILIIDIAEEGLDLAIRFLWAGHDVKFFQPNTKYRAVGKGLVTRVSDWRDHMKWADLIIPTDVSKYQEELDWYHQHGYPIFGANKSSADWELDREKGIRIMQQSGIQTLPYTKFEDVDEAIAHVLAAGDDARFVSKPCGDDNRAMSYVSKNPSDMIYMLEMWKKGGTFKGAFILQEFCKGVEFAVGGWWGPGGWEGVWEENFEHKKLMCGEKGPNTGEMGTVMKYVDHSNLAEETLVKVEGALAGAGFIGNIDISCIVNKDGIWPMEWTMRMGWPAAMIQLSLHKGDPAQWMLDSIQGKNTLRVRGDTAVGIVVAQPDFPYNKKPDEDMEGTPIYGIHPGNIEHIHFAQVMAGTAPIVENGTIKQQEIFLSAGSNLLTVVGLGPTVCRAADKAYKLLDELVIPNSPLYRTDIGKRLEHDIPELQKLGFAEDWVY
jgi:phosphoribosylamine---glycine ligase